MLIKVELKRSFPSRLVNNSHIFIDNNTDYYNQITKLHIK